MMVFKLKLFLENVKSFKEHVLLFLFLSLTLLCLNKCNSYMCLVIPPLFITNQFIFYILFYFLFLKRKKDFNEKKKYITIKMNDGL